MNSFQITTVQPIVVYKSVAYKKSVHVHVAIFLCFFFSMMHFPRDARFSCRTIFMLQFFLVSIFSFNVNVNTSLNPLSANFTKWSNTLKQFVGNLPTNCLSVFDHFVGLALKGLSSFEHSEGSPRAIRHLVVQRALEHSEENWELGNSEGRHSGTWTLRALRYLGTQGT